MSLPLATSDRTPSCAHPHSTRSCSSGPGTFQGTQGLAASRCMQADQASQRLRLNCPLEFGLPSRCATISLLCESTRRTCSRSIVYNPPTRSPVDPRSVGCALLYRRLVRRMAGLRRPRLCCNSHRIFILLRSDAAVRRARSSGIPLRRLRRARGLLPGRSYLPRCAAGGCRYTAILN